MSVLTIDAFMADRGHPYMTTAEAEAAKEEWTRWESHIAAGGCPRYATVEIRPSNGNFEDLTHSCDWHIGDLLGHRPEMPAPPCYEVRAFSGDESRKHWCCAVDRTTPAPTATPALDLDAVERKIADGYTKSWLVTSDKSVLPTIDGACTESWAFSEADARDMATGAYHDGATEVATECRVEMPLDDVTAMIAEVRSLRAQVCRLVSGQAIESDALCQHHDADLKALAERDEARAELGRVQATVDALRGVREQNEAMTAEIARLTAELAAARKDLDAAAEAGIKRGRSWEATEWEAAFGVRNRREAVDKLRAAEEQLAAVRAVPADVEAAIESLRRAEEVDARAMTGQSLAARVLAEAALRAAITRVIAAATPAPPTVRRVGEALETGEGAAILASLPVVEYEAPVRRGGPRQWRQMRVGGETRIWRDGAWTSWRSGSDYIDAILARIVPAHLADYPPESRGPIGGEKGE